MKFNTRTEIINYFIEKNNYKSYLEIGVKSGKNFNQINIENKTGVDIDKNTLNFVPDCLIMSSDKFFKINKQKFDIIFIDGLHESTQVKKDIENSLKILNINGVIICHDMLPPDEAHQIIPRQQKEWTGDCWKAWVQLRSLRSDLKMLVLNCDYGCGVIQFGKQELITYNNLDWISFQENKINWLNLVNEL